jgi:hypothetical protein
MVKAPVMVHAPGCCRSRAEREKNYSCHTTVLQIFDSEEEVGSADSHTLVRRLVEAKGCERTVVLCRPGLVDTVMALLHVDVRDLTRDPAQRETHEHVQEAEAEQLHVAAQDNAHRRLEDSHTSLRDQEHASLDADPHDAVGSLDSAPMLSGLSTEDIRSLVGSPRNDRSAQMAQSVYEAD